jgi:hypothetical protein
VVSISSIAGAEPTARVGLTYGLVDPTTGPDVEVGSLIAVGMRAGPIVGELEWAYLSFFDPAASPGGVHRLGATLRADLLQVQRFSSTHTWYGELGAGERFGRWLVDANHAIPPTAPVPEAHLGIGFELDDRLTPHRRGWQFGLRLAISRHEDTTFVACRGPGSGCTSALAQPNGLDRAWLLEWMFVI